MTTPGLSRRVAYAVCGLFFACGSHAWAEEKPIPKGDPPVNVQLTPAAVDIGDSLYYAVQPNLGHRWLAFAIDTHRNSLGIEIGELDAALRTQLDLAEGSGVLITAVSPDSEAAKAGLQKHDIVLKIEDQAVAGQQAFDEWLGKQQGKTVQFHLLRKGKPLTIPVTVAQMPVYRTYNTVIQLHNPKTVDLLGYANAYDVLLAGSQDKHYRIGLTLAEADDVLRSQLRLAAGEGLVATDILADTPAARAGIQKNDVLVKLDGKRLTTIEAVNAQVQEIKDRKVVLALIRAGMELSIEVAPQLMGEPNVGQEFWRTVGEQVHHRYRVHLRSLEEATLNSAEIKAPPAAEQITNLKKQLADLQKAVESLDAALKADLPEKQESQEKK